MVNSAFANENLVGNPLSTQRLQTGDTCWAHSTLHLFESIVQKDSGMIVSGKLDAHFWFHIFRNRLRGRYLKKSSFVDSLQDKDIFNEKGFPQEALNLINRFGINADVKTQPSPYTQFDFKTQSSLRINDDTLNQYKSLSFKKFKPILEIENQDIAFEQIDQFLIKSGLKPAENIQLKLEDLGIIKLHSDTFSLSSLQRLNEFVWVPTRDKAPLAEDISYAYRTTEFGFKILSHPLTFPLASEMIRKSLMQNIPVPVNVIDHSVLILAMDEKFFYVVDSRVKKVEKFLIKDFKFNVAHITKSILDEHLVFP